MNVAKTLLEMASVEIPFDAKSSAVVLIDYQREYTDGKLPLYDVDTVVAESKKLLTWAREKRLPVVHVLHDGTPGGVFDTKTIGAEVIPAVAPIDGEFVVHKTYPNSFTQTELASVLEKTGKKSIIFAGLMTHMCLEATVRGAFDRGFQSLVVASTTTTRDLPGVKASALKTASLAALSDLVAIVEDDLTTLDSRYPH